MQKVNCHWEVMSKRHRDHVSGLRLSVIWISITRLFREVSHQAQALPVLPGKV